MEADLDYIVAKDLQRLYSTGVIHEIISGWRSDCDYIVVDSLLKLYFSGG